MAFIQNYNAQDDKTETTGSTTGENVAPIISSGVAPDAGDVQLTATPTTSQQAQNTFGTLSNYLSNAQSNQVNNTAPISITSIPNPIKEPDVNGLNPVSDIPAAQRRTNRGVTDDINGNPISTGPAPTIPVAQPMPVIKPQPVGPVTPIPTPFPVIPQPIFNPQPIGPVTPIPTPFPVISEPIITPAPITVTPVPEPFPIMPSPAPRLTNEQKYGKPRIGKTPSGITVFNYGKPNGTQFNKLKNYLGKK